MEIEDNRMAVGVRVKPYIGHDRIYLRSQPKNKSIILIDSETTKKHKKQSKEFHFSFDHVFAQDSTQAMVYSQSCETYV